MTSFETSVLGRQSTLPGLGDVVLDEATLAGAFDGAGVASRFLRAPERSGSVSEWADANRWLVKLTSAEPGRWRTWRTPYLREPMDSFAQRGVRMITMMAVPQSGKTEALFNMLGFAIDQEPGPALFVEPNQSACRTMSMERIEPMIDASPCLRKQVTEKVSDKTTYSYRFSRMLLRLAWSNSPTALAMSPCRYTFLDEMDKFPMYVGVEAPPEKLAQERTKTFSNSVDVGVSSPTLDTGTIYKRFMSSDGREWHVPCVRCDAFFVMGFQLLQWGDERDPDIIVRDSLAWMECPECGGRIEDHEKDAMVSRGVYAPRGCRVDVDGNVVGDYTESSHRGYHITAFMSPFTSFSKIAAEWLNSYQDAGKLQNFHNAWLAEPWIETLEDVDEDGLVRITIPHFGETLYKGAQLLTAGVDIHKHRIDYSIRAWGVNWQSWQIESGSLKRIPVKDPSETEGVWDDLEVVLGRTWRAEHGVDLGVRGACIDSGYDPYAVYKFTRRDPSRYFAVKGTSTQVAPVRMVLLEASNVTGKRIRQGQRLYHVNVTYFKDRVQAWRSDERPRWWIHDKASARYYRQIVGERLVLKRAKTTGAGRGVWEPRTQSTEVHFWDCEVYDAACADILMVGRLRAVSDVVVKPARSGGKGRGRKGIRTRYG